jgi:SAM-dependent methyltransferase
MDGMGGGKNREKNPINKNLTNNNGSFLDIGCSNGYFTNKIANLTSLKPYGVDFIEEDIKKAEKMGISAKIADIDSGIPFNDSCFDLIVSNQVIEHVMETDNFFREIYRLLKPEGYAIINCPNITSFHNLGLMILGMQPLSFHSSDIQVGNPLRGTKIGNLSSGLRHVKIFTVDALKDLARFHGFKVEYTWGYGHYYIPTILSNFLSKITSKYSIFIGIIIKKIDTE